MIVGSERLYMLAVVVLVVAYRRVLVVVVVVFGGSGCDCCGLGARLCVGGGEGKVTCGVGGGGSGCCGFCAPLCVGGRGAGGGMLLGVVALNWDRLAWLGLSVSEGTAL